MGGMGVTWMLQSVTECHHEHRDLLEEPDRAEDSRRHLQMDIEFEQ